MPRIFCLPYGYWCSACLVVVAHGTWGPLIVGTSSVADGVVAQADTAAGAGGTGVWVLSLALAAAVGALFAWSLGRARRRRQSTRRVRELKQRLSQAEQKLKRLHDEHNRLFATMQHELGSPLSTIKLLVAVLDSKDSKEVPDDRLDAVRNIGTCAEHLLKVLSDLVDLARAQSDSVRTRRSVVDLDAMLRSGLSLVMAQAKAKGVTMALPPHTGLFVRVDEVRVKQALVNLVANAVKFTAPGGEIGIDVGRPTDGRGQVALSVWDTGRGIPPDLLPRVFDPFVQGPAAAADDASGAGLGLALVKRIVEQHGGTAEVISEVGQGTRFTITLPLAPNAADTSRRSTSKILEPV